MEPITIETKRRWDLGKNGSHRQRVSGYVPAVLYGKDEVSVPLAVDRKMLDHLLHTPGGRNRTYTLKLDEQNTKEVLIKDFQLDPVRDELIHVDFLAVSRDRAVQVKVPVEAVGVAVGVKTFGGILGILMHHMPVECFPQDIPETIRVDVSGLGINQNLKVKHVDLGDRVKILADPETIVVHVEGTRGAETAPTAAETTAEAK